MTEAQQKHSQQVGHIHFETIIDPRSNPTFKLFPGMPGDFKSTYTGIVQKGMGSELRRLAAHFDDLERLIK